MTMRHDGCSCQRVMEPDTSEKRIFHYVQQELPNRYFAIVRMEWHDENEKVIEVDEVKLIDDGLMDKFILDVQNHIANPTKESAELIANVRCWSSWLANGIKIEPIFNGKKKACAFIPWPLSGLLLLSSRITGQQPEFE